MDAQPPEFDSTIAGYYDEAPEEDRLEQGAFLLEAIRTRELIQRFAPAAPGTVVNIGGAAGAYALWLTDAGYTVHLLDPVPRQARRTPVCGCDLALGFSVGRSGARSFSRPAVCRDRRARCPRRTAQESDRAARLLHHRHIFTALKTSAQKCSAPACS